MHGIELSSGDTKEGAFHKLQGALGRLALNASAFDFERPWGGFFVINEEQTDRFSSLFFPDVTLDDLQRGGNKLSPKILAVEPGQRLSWQYHRRRAELWRVIAGPVGIITSPNDEQKPVTMLMPGVAVQFDSLVRHRLVGLDNWGVVAEIWQHTNPDWPSNEADIVRLEDDFGR